MPPYLVLIPVVLNDSDNRFLRLLIVFQRNRKFNGNGLANITFGCHWAINKGKCWSPNVCLWITCAVGKLDWQCQRHQGHSKHRAIASTSRSAADEGMMVYYNSHPWRKNKSVLVSSRRGRFGKGFQKETRVVTGGAPRP